MKIQRKQPCRTIGRDSREQIVIFKKLTTFFSLNARFDVANIIVSYKIFEKPFHRTTHFADHLGEKDIHFREVYNQ